MAKECSDLRRPWVLVVACLSLSTLIFLTISTIFTPFHPGKALFPQISSHHKIPITSLPHAPSVEFNKPADIKIIGLVFFGRKSRVEIMRCFLEVGLSIVTMKAYPSAVSDHPTAQYGKPGRLARRGTLGRKYWQERRLSVSGEDTCKQREI